MTLYMLFAAIGMLITTARLSRAAISGRRDDVGTASITSGRGGRCESTRVRRPARSCSRNSGVSAAIAPTQRGSARHSGLFGRPVTDPGCGALTVDEEYLREAILNPSATVAMRVPARHAVVRRAS